MINVIKKFKGHAQIVKINNPTDSIGVIIEGSGNPIYLQIDAVPGDKSDHWHEKIRTNTLLIFVRV